MGKMSEEQKAANKEASKERARVFSARRRQFEAERTAAEESAKQLPEYAAMVAANEEFESSLVQRDAAIRDIDNEIARLQARRDQVRQQHGLAIDAAKAKRNQTFNANADSVGRLVGAVKERYPDMVGVYLVSQWQRPEGV